MTTKTAALGAALSALLCAACASAPTGDIEFETEVDPKARFAGYKSYAWLAKAAVVRDPKGELKLPSFDADAEIKFLIDSDLRKRGWIENSSTPDLFVVFAIGIDMEALALKTDPKTKVELKTKEARAGLLIALIDSETGFVVWAGAARGNMLKDPEDETVKARLAYSVTNLLKKVPK